jgi:catechol 2,3-dioxygenase-like lactoylglutathione lyase family enzyme
MVERGHPADMTAVARQPHGLGLRPHVNRFAHVTVNVSDLARARAFWEATFPVRTVAKTGGTRQRFASLGIDDGRFDGYMLEDASGLASRGIHLVQWQHPRPTGDTYRGLSHVGWYRLCAISDDVWPRYEAVLAAGGSPFAEPRAVGARKSGQDDERFTFSFTDPDGIVLEWVTSGPRIGGWGPDRTYHQCVNCRSLRTSFAFYTRVVGLDPIRRTMPVAPAPARERPAFDADYDGDVFMDAVFLGHRADTRSPIDLVQWLSPPPQGEVYPSPVNLGIARLALEVDDIDAAYRALLEAPGLDRGAVAGPPETWDMGELGERKVVVFRDPDGCALELIERPGYTWDTDPARDSYPPLAG